MNRRSFLKVAAGLFAGVMLRPGTPPVVVAPAMTVNEAKLVTGMKAAEAVKTPGLVHFHMRNVEEYGNVVTESSGGRLASVTDSILRPNYEITRGLLLKRGVVLRPAVYRESGPIDRFARLHHYSWYALGYNVWLQKYIAFIVSATFAGLAGVLLVYYNGFVSPSELHLVTSAEVLIMVILGGVGTLFGPAIGAGIIILIKNFVSGYTEHWMIILGALYMATVMLAPQGVYKLFKRSQK